MKIVAHACTSGQQRMAEVFGMEDTRVLHQFGKDVIGMLVGVAGDGIQRLKLRPSVEPSARSAPCRLRQRSTASANCVPRQRKKLKW